MPRCEHNVWRIQGKTKQSITTSWKFFFWALIQFDLHTGLGTVESVLCTQTTKKIDSNRTKSNNTKFTVNVSTYIVACTALNWTALHCLCARYIPVLCYFCVQCALISLPEISATFLLQLIELNQSINFQFSRTISDKYKFLVMPVGWTRPLKPFYVGFFFLCWLMLFFYN